MLLPLITNSNLIIQFFGEHYPPNVWITHTPIPLVIIFGLIDGISCKIDGKFLIYLRLNTRAEPKPYSVFAYSIVLWGESISNDSNGSCRNPPHIISIGGSNGYID